MIWTGLSQYFLGESTKKHQALVLRVNNIEFRRPKSQQYKKEKEKISRAETIGGCRFVVFAC